MNKTMKKNTINPYIIIGIILLIIPMAISIIGNILSSYDPLKTDALNKLQKPSIIYLMGTDDVGRDIFTRVMIGIRVSLLIGLSVTMISTIFGMCIGIIAAYYKNTEKFLMRIVDGIMAFPSIILAIVLAGILGAGTKNIIVALSISYIPTLARVTRNATLELLSKEYVESAIVLGKSDIYIIFNYIIPNILSSVIVQITYTFAMAILHESILSFLGVGIKAPTPSLGGMVNDGRNYISIAPWVITFPGLTISWIVLALNMVGDGLSEWLNPRKKNRG